MRESYEKNDLCWNTPRDTKTRGVFYIYGTTHNERSKNDFLINRGLNWFRCGLNTAHWEGVLGQNACLKHWTFFQRTESCLQLKHRTFGARRVRSSYQLESIRTRGSQQGLNSSTPKLLTSSLAPEQSSGPETLVVVFPYFLSSKEIFRLRSFHKMWMDMWTDRCLSKNACPAK